ncbi:glycoside hydrolase family 17 protein [Aulographum hederae CBS 113979]|uniref:Probable beta-glucosidase btgE n=1 Tax=Aulographum hederae CBS 113979 TaxID=1176131 RepID=A0A6G1H9L1_9PEZI|nr:glycoside hydrolase family 17 protein [Aulographum hederae CBS 113979]
MKVSIVALAAGALIGGASASVHERHADFHKRWASDSAPAPAETCGCKTYTTTIYGEATLIPQLPSAEVNSTSVLPETTPAPVSTVIVVPVPTPMVTTCETPGTYTFPASTVTLTSTTVVCSASSTSVAPGPCTYGGVTTSVSASTTVTCPYATVETSGSVVTSIIKTTTYVCPSAGVYTIAPTTTSVSESTVFVYPVPETYEPGTYTAPVQVVTITETSKVYVCPFETISPSSSAPPPPPSTTAEASSAPPPPPPSSYVAPSPSKVSSVAPPPPPPSSYVAPPPESTYEAPPPESTYEAPSSVAPKPSPSSKPKPSSAPVHGDKWAITYTPYTTDGQCKSSDEISSDVAGIAAMGFSTVRVYATDCDALENVGGACKASGLKIILGVFIGPTGIGGSQDQVTDITSWGSSGNWGMVEMIVVGNEAIFNSYCSAEELAVFITTCKGAFGGAGYNGPVTTTEPLNVLTEAASSLCGVMDVVSANIQPFFNADVTADDAGDFVASQIKLVADCCPGLEAYNLECGWPSSGSPNGAAVPGRDAQQKAIAGIIEKAGGKTVIFSFQDDSWKAPGEFGVEQHFGCSDHF